MPQVEPTLKIEIGARAVSRHEWQMAGAPAVEELQPVEPRLFKGMVRVPQAWLEAPLGQGWTLAVRLAVDVGGRVVPAEVRVYPREPRTPGAGEWSAAWRGVRARTPKGGLTTRRLKERSSP